MGGSCSWVMRFLKASTRPKEIDKIPSRYEWLSFKSFSWKKVYRDWSQTLLLVQAKILSDITHEHHLVLSLSLISINESQTSASTREQKEDFPAELSNYSLVLFLNFEQLLIWRLSLSSYCINLSCKPFICFVFLCWSLVGGVRCTARSFARRNYGSIFNLHNSRVHISDAPPAHAVMKLDVKARSVQLMMNEKKHIPKPSKSTCTFLSHHDFKYFQNTSSMKKGSAKAF